nr:MAG TPA: hypothetical protein [Caudoviricetes sp.]
MNTMNTFIKVKYFNYLWGAQLIQVVTENTIISGT